MHCAIDQGEKVQPQTNAAGCQIIRDQLESYRERFDKLKSDILDAKIDMEAILSCWVTFERAFEQLNIWLKETEVRLKSDSDPKADLAEKKALLEKIKVFVLYSHSMLYACSVPWIGKLTSVFLDLS